MDQKRKEFLQALVKELLRTIGKELEGVAKAKKVYQTKWAGIEAEKGNYSAEYLESLRNQVRQNYLAARETGRENILAALDKLGPALSERHGELDLSDPAWTTALMMIELGGLDNETIRQINAQFAHNQPALRALQAIYKERGFKYDGGVDRMVYDIPGRIENLKRAASTTLENNRGNINTFASDVGKLAELEGFEFNSLIDPDGFVEAVNRGAGFAVNDGL